MRRNPRSNAQCDRQNRGKKTAAGICFTSALFYCVLRRFSASALDLPATRVAGGNATFFLRGRHRGYSVVAAAPIIVVALMAVELNALGAAALSDLLKSLALFDIVIANIELGQRPHILNGIGDSSWACNLTSQVSTHIHTITA